MDTIVTIGSEVRHRSVFELRYSQGYEYWDRGGKVVNEILQKSDSWQLKNVDRRGTQIIDPERNLAFSFGPTKADLSQTQSEDVGTLVDVTEFATIAEELTAIVSAIVNPADSERLGYRVWRIYGTGTKDEAEQMIRKLQCFCVPEDLGDVTEASCTLVFERPTHMIRAAVVSFEQNLEIPRHVLETARSRPERLDRKQKQARLAKYRAQKSIKNYPSCGVLFDTDVYLEDPPYSSNLAITDFVLDAERDIESIRSSILRARDE